MGRCDTQNASGVGRTAARIQREGCDSGCWWEDHRLGTERVYRCGLYGIAVPEAEYKTTSLI